MKQVILMCLCALIISGCASGQQQEISDIIRDLDMVGCSLAELRHTKDHTVIECDQRD